MKKAVNFSLLTFITLFLIHCGGNTNNNNSTSDSTQKGKDKPEKKAEACVNKQDINFKVKDYKYQMKEPFAFDGKIDVKKAWYVLSDGKYFENGKEDKVEKMTIYLANYDGAEKTKPSKEGEMMIETTLYARATKLIAGVYEHSGSGIPLYSSTKIITTKGEVYFNWLAGMEKQGKVEVKVMDGKVVCGEYSLKVDKIDSDMIGFVSLNGTFYAEKK
jgi:hypothetical protein